MGRLTAESIDMQRTPGGRPTLSNRWTTTAMEKLSRISLNQCLAFTAGFMLGAAYESSRVDAAEPFQRRVASPARSCHKNSD